MKNCEFAELLSGPRAAPTIAVPVRQLAHVVRLVRGHAFELDDDLEESRDAPDKRWSWLLT